ncbi:SCAN domain-containing protein 3-like [Centruroides sculpturatus]|uniref:SCAN domain-containing protein 3-like n=1 Tax=Centruroides sculpturatus TaxID=218467 RepID=UPI000C6EEE20|nr:SCAN domain-containing protein 3-like [Centruroides sculpturatus]
MELFKSSLARSNFKYFSNLRVLKENEKISDRDLEIYIKHLDKLREDFKARFKELENMHVSEWFANPFDIKIDNEDSETGLEGELSEVCVDLEAKALFKNKNLGECEIQPGVQDPGAFQVSREFWSNNNIATKYPKLRAEAEPFLLAFPTSYVVEAGFSHANAILTKQRNRLNLENRGDLRLKLTNFQPNINNLAASLQRSFIKINLLLK